jgi:hypothetical protein
MPLEYRSEAINIHLIKLVCVIKYLLGNYLWDTVYAVKEVEIIT